MTEKRKTKKVEKSFRTALKNHKINGTTDAQVDSLMALYWGQIYVR